MTVIKRAIRWATALGLMSVAVWLLYYAANHSQVAVHRDITVFWSAERLFVHHQNPYDAASVMRLELAAGAPVERPVMMLNPPVALAFAIPLGLVDIRTGIFLWALITIVCLLLSVRMLWVLNGRGSDRSYMLAYAFAPVMACLSIGQFSMIVLLGLVIFLAFHRSRPFLAGLCAPLLATKPHLLIPFAVVALLWTIRGRRYSFVLGALLGMAIVSAAALAIDHQLFAQYLAMPRQAASIDAYGVPNLSSQLHRLHPGANFLQYVPALCGTLWAVAWYWRRRDTWDWNDGGLILIAVSVVVAPHSWLNDEVLVIPAIVAGLSRCVDHAKALLPLAMLNGIALLLLFLYVPFFSGAYLWTSVAWLLWYLYARRLAPATPGVGGGKPLADAAIA